MSIKEVPGPEVPTSEASSAFDRDQTGFAARLGGDAVLICSGELDPATTPVLGRSLRRLLDLAPDRVVVDLSRVSFFDAAAIGELVRARESSRAAGSDLVVRVPLPFGRRILGIAGLTDLIAEEPRQSTDPRHATGEVGAHAAELVSAWEAACATSRYGAAPLAFDSTTVLAAITPLIDDPSSIDPHAAVRSLAAARLEEASATAAVMQLWALRDVLYVWVEANRGLTAWSNDEERRSADLEAVLAEMASSALAEIEQHTLVDPLTGLLNRRALDRDLLASLATARRHGQCLSVVMIDVDGLKTTNDQFGHAVGDDTLRGIAADLTSALRAGDNAYRIGGDEFVLVLPELCPEDVDGIMRRIGVEAQGAFTWGCAWVKGDEQAAPDAERAAHLLEQADQRMLDYRTRIRGSRQQADAPRALARPLADPAVELAGRFTDGNRSSVVIDEAKGLIAEHFDIGINEASILLRWFSIAQRQPLLAAAAALVDRTVDVECLAPHRSGLPDAPEGDTEHGSDAAARTRQS